jgi:hypothetical protein
VADIVALPGTSRGPAEGATPKLTARETVYVEALAEGGTQNHAATVAGVSVRTARRWAHRPEIVAAVRARLSASLAQARAVLASGAARASTALVKMAAGEEEADAARVSACRAVTEGALKMVEISELEARLAELEARLSPTGRT